MPRKILPSEFLCAVMDTARREIGVKETSENIGQRIQRYQSATWMEPGPWPWCAAFIAWCFHAAALRCPPPPWFHSPTTPRAFSLENWGRSVGFLLSTVPAPAAPGDIVIFNFSHVGFLESPGRPRLTTIEGNTPGDHRAVRDGVFRCHRLPSLVRSIIHLS